MKTSEEILLKYGFNQRELQKLKNNISRYGGSLDSVTSDLANRFNAVKWVTVVALIILLLTLILASEDTSITLGYTLALILPFIWYLAPAKLAYKSWRYRKIVANSERNL